MKAALKIVEVKRPISGKTMGYRLVCAHVNRARYDVFSGQYVQSFAYKYRIAERGDKTKANDFTKTQIDRFKKYLTDWHKLNEFIQY